MARTIPSWLVTAAALASIAALAADPRDASACSCRPPPPPDAALVAADAVFEARVGAVSTAGNATGIASTGSDVQISLTVLRTWKGAAVVVGREVNVVTPSGSASCGFGFQPNETYLVYASRLESGAFATNICTRTRRSRDATDDFTALDAAGGANPGSGGATSSGAGGGSSSGGSTTGDVPPFEADSKVPSIVADAGSTPGPTPPAATPSRGCAGCAVPSSDAGAAGGLAVIALGAAIAWRRARRARRARRGPGGLRARLIRAS